MKVIDTDSKFKVIIKDDIVFYYKGSCNKDWNDIIEYINKTRSFPEYIRGNFGFIYLQDDFYIAAVDHLCSVPLFYTSNHISTVFFDVLHSLPNPTRNFVKNRELMFFAGHSIDNKTTYDEIMRLEPGTYIQNNKIHTYIDFYKYKDADHLDPEYLKKIIEESFLSKVKDKNALLCSSGTDSVLMLGLIKKFNLFDKFKIVHIYSKHEYMTELNEMKELEKFYNINVNYVDVGDVCGDVVPEISDRVFKSFWYDDQFSIKYLAIKTLCLENHAIFTGEVGDQLFGGPKHIDMIPFVLQSLRLTTEKIADLWIELSRTYQKSSIANRNINKYYKSYINVDNEKIENAHNNLNLQIQDIFSKCQLTDLANTFTFMNYKIKAPYRVYPYTQIKENIDWAHPFETWELFDYMFTLKSKEVFRNGMLKGVLYELYKNYVIEIAWKKPKSGPCVPSQRGFNANK